MPDTSTKPRLTTGDLWGGLASAFLSITGNIAAGVIAFAPLGPQYVSQGILAGMLSSIVAGLLASLCGGAPGMVSGPKMTTGMAFAALLTQLQATGQFGAGTDQLLALAFAAVLISGSVQILLGAFRIGGLVRFMPYPVVAGIRNTTAILLISSQIWPFLGIDAELARYTVADISGLIRPWALLVGTVSVLIALRGGRILPKPTVPVVAIVTASLLHYLIRFLAPDAQLGGELGTIDLALPELKFGSMGSALKSHVGLLPAVVFGGLTMAVLDSVSALITLVSYQSIADRRFDANKQLVGQGIGSAAVAFVGGLTNSGILARAAVNHRAGGRTRASGVVNALGVLALVAAFAQLLGKIPKAAIAGLIIAIAIGLFDRWVLGQLNEALRKDVKDPRDNFLAVGLMTLVVVVGVTFGLVEAVEAGVAASVVVFVAQMSRSPIRRLRTGATVRSARRRDEHLTEVLAKHGDRIAVIELEGSVFFGSADSLALRAEELAEGGVDFLLMDLRRVRGIDATGYKVLGQTYKRLTALETIVAFSHVLPRQLNEEIAEDLLQSGVPSERMFESADQALEFFEEALLLNVGADPLSTSGWTLEQFGDAWGLTASEQERFHGYVERKHFESGEVVFTMGDAGRSMYLLCRGDADVSIPVDGGLPQRRLATFQDGTVLGEMALLDGAPRAATVTASGTLDIYELTHSEFLRLGREEPEMALKVQAAIGRTLGARIRGANDLILELDS